MSTPESSPSTTLARHRVNSITNGDRLSVLQAMRDDTSGLTVFSPPHDNIRDYRNERRFYFSAFGKSSHRVAKDGGICAVVIEDGKNVSRYRKSGVELMEILFLRFTAGNVAYLGLMRQGHNSNSKPPSPKYSMNLEQLEPFLVERLVFQFVNGDMPQ